MGVSNLYQIISSKEPVAECFDGYLNSDTNIPNVRFATIGQTACLSNSTYLLSCCQDDYCYSWKTISSYYPSSLPWSSPISVRTVRNLAATYFILFM